MPTELTPSKIKEIFDYDAATGILRWKIKPCSNVRIGDVTGCPAPNGYLQSRFCKKLYYTHRLVFAWAHGRWPKDQIDHTNGIRTDNRIENLREVTSSENGKNQRLHERNKSGYTGVRWREDRNRWRACITVDYKVVYLGSFICLADAAKARRSAEVKYSFHPNHGTTRTTS